MQGDFDNCRREYSVFFTPGRKAKEDRVIRDGGSRTEKGVSFSFVSIKYYVRSVNLSKEIHSPF